MDTADQLLAKGNLLLDQTKAQGGTAFAGSTYDLTNPVIKTTDTSAQAYKMPPPPVDTAATAITAHVDANQNLRSIAQESQDKANELEAKYNKSESNLTKLMGALGKKGETQLNLESKAGIDEKTKAINDINSQIDAKNLAYRREIEAIQNNGSLTKEQAAPAIAEVQRKAASELADLSIIQNARNNDLTTAQSLVDKKIKLMFEPIEQQLDFQKYFFENNRDMFNKADQRAFETKIEEDNRTYAAQREDAKTLEDTKLKTLFEAQSNGAPNSVLQAIQAAKTPEEAMAASGQYIGLLDRQLKKAQLSKIYQDIQDTLDANKPIDINSLVKEGASPTDANSSVLTAILGSNKIGQGTKTQIANLLSVINAAGDLAQSRQNGKFQGLNPLQKIGDLFFPESGLSKEAIENRGQLDAINLKVQQWASGASLTAQQIEQVDRFTPKKSDSDQAVRTKLNNLTNFMLGQTRSQLQSEGIDYTPAKVNLFETFDMLKNLSPEQKKELQAEGLI